MTRRDPIICLRHMLDHAREAVEMAHGRTREDLESDRLFNLAMVRLLEIVGEAATRIPVERRAQWPTIPWEDIVGFRNRIVHGYDMVDLNIVWAIVQGDLPPLISELQRILEP